jgi:hypothetical protein
MSSRCERNVMFSKAYEAPFMVISQTFTSKFAPTLKLKLHLNCAHRDCGRRCLESEEKRQKTAKNA